MIILFMLTITAFNLKVLLIPSWLYYRNWSAFLDIELLIKIPEKFFTEGNFLIWAERKKLVNNLTPCLHNWGSYEILLFFISHYDYCLYLILIIFYHFAYFLKHFTLYVSYWKCLAFFIAKLVWIYRLNFLTKCNI